MAAQVITIEELAEGTRSTDLVGGANMVSCATGDTWTIAAGAGPLPVSAGGVANTLRDIILVVKYSGTSTVTVNAGAYPPSARSGLGTRTFAGVNAEVRICPIDGGRHIQAAGTITGSNSGATVLIGAFRMPKTIN